MTSLIGRRMLRREDRPLLTGQAEFVDDLELEGMLHIRFFRSPIAHGRIEALDLEAARAVPGVVAAARARRTSPSRRCTHRSRTPTRTRRRGRSWPRAWCASWGSRWR